jgi:hypothetical protein
MTARYGFVVLWLLIANGCKAQPAASGADAGDGGDTDDAGDIEEPDEPFVRCPIPNGTGAQDSLGNCQVDACRSGYAVDVDSNSCRPSDLPSVTVSSRRVAPGNQIDLAWNGGAYATSCRVYLTDATRTEEDPFGPLPITGRTNVVITSDTRFNVVCVNSQNQPLANATATVRIDANPARAAYREHMSLVGAQRHALWDRPIGDWEVSYDANGTPADAVPMTYVWDNPIDDDAYDEYVNGFGFRFDTLDNVAAPGFFTIDRATNETQRHKGASIHRRDEYLRRAFGFTLEFRAKLYLNSGYYPETNTYAESVNAYYQMEDGTTIGVFLTPYALKAGGYNAPRIGPVPTVNMDTTVFNTYRIVQYPGSSHFYVYVNGSAQPILEADGNQVPIGSWTNHEDPIVIIGGESVTRTNFALDYVRYRRGAYPPGVPMPPPLSRSPAALPDPLPKGANAEFTPDAGAFNATGLDYDAYGIFHALNSLGGCTQGWTQEANGTLGYHGSGDTCMLRNLPGLVGMGDVTVEAKLKVLPTSQPRGFSIVLSDEMGSVSVFFSPSKVETGLGIKNVGWRDIAVQSAPMDTTNDFHVYRLVRRVHQLHAHLYVDDNPVPVIIDQRLDASTGLSLTPADVGLEFGAMFRPGPSLQGHVEIEYIRWAPTAFAPRLPPE